MNSSRFAPLLLVVGACARPAPAPLPTCRAAATANPLPVVDAGAAPGAEATATAAADLPEVLSVEGSFTAPGSRERLVVREGGPTNGASGGKTAYLYDANNSLLRTITSFPAEECVSMLRPGRASLLLCTLVNTWNSFPNYGVALFDLGAPLEPDTFAQGPKAGALRPVQTILATDEERVLSRLTCQALGPLAALPLAARPVNLRLPVAPAHATFVVRAPVRTKAELDRVCASFVADKKQATARMEVPEEGDAQGLADRAARVVGAPRRIVVRLALDARGDRMVLEDGKAAAGELEALGFRVTP